MLCEQIPNLEVVKAYNNPELFIQESQQLEYDLCILDIEMPGLNGMQVAEQINDKSVIFTTAYKEYAAEAFDINAIDYIRKPVTIDRLSQAIQKAMMQIQKSNSEKKYVQINTDKGKFLLYFDSLVYIKSSETDSRDKIALLADHTTLTLKNISFEKLLKQLPAHLFVRINKQEIVGLKFIRFYNHETISLLQNDLEGKSIELQLSETFKSGFLHKVSV